MTKIELILVFKKNISSEKAEIFLNSTGVPYREGMDSGRGKIYFYNTGPKYILTFKTKQERKQFEREYQNSEEVHEIYIPNWKIQKD